MIDQFSKSVRNSLCSLTLNNRKRIVGKGRYFIYLCEGKENRGKIGIEYLHNRMNNYVCGLCFNISNKNNKNLINRRTWRKHWKKKLHI